MVKTAKPKIPTLPSPIAIVIVITVFCIASSSLLPPQSMDSTSSHLHILYLFLLPHLRFVHCNHPCHSRAMWAATIYIILGFFKHAFLAADQPCFFKYSSAKNAKWRIRPGSRRVLKNFAPVVDEDFLRKKVEQEKDIV